MDKIFRFLAALFFATTLIFASMYNYTNSKAQRLDGELKGCKNNVKEFNDAQIRAGGTIQKVKEAVKVTKSDCNCYPSAVDKPILDRVRNKHK